MSILRVTDHALVRFMERVGHFPMEAIRTKIMEMLERGGAMAARIGATRYNIVLDGMAYIIVDNVVVSIVSERDAPATTGRSIQPVHEKPRHE